MNSPKQGVEEKLRGSKLLRNQLAVTHLVETLTGSSSSFPNRINVSTGDDWRLVISRRLAVTSKMLSLSKQESPSDRVSRKPTSLLLQ